MSYALVVNDASDLQIVDLEMVEGRERGRAVTVSSADGSSSYEATLIDSGTSDEMEARMEEWKDLSLEELRKKACERRRTRGVTPLSMLDDSLRPKKITTRKKKRATVTSSAAPSIACLAQPVVIEDDLNVEDMTDRELLMGILKKVVGLEKTVDDIKKSERDRMEWQKGVTDDLTAIKSFIELTADRTEAGAVGMGAVKRSIDHQENVLTNMEMQLTGIVESMPQKLEVEYIYMTESAVRELDRTGESEGEFGQRIAARLFSDEELLLHVENRNIKKFDWLVDVVYRRRGYKEMKRSYREVRGKIKAHLNQKALRARGALGIPHPLAPTKKRKLERQAQRDELTARIEQLQQQQQERRASRTMQSIDAAAQLLMRQKGLVDDDGQDTVYHRPSRPPFHGQSHPVPTPSSRPTRPLTQKLLFPIERDVLFEEEGPSTSRVTRRESPLYEEQPMRGAAEEQDDVIFVEREYTLAELQPSVWDYET